MIAGLGLAPICEENFLTALDTLGKESKTRTLVMIDAINETENPKIWQEGIIKFCEQIISYPNLALAMSVRDVEKNKFITPTNEKYIEDEIVEIRHKGFEGIELEAVRTFCDALGVEFPKVPLHTYRLFINPGMLFIYIEAIKVDTKKVNSSIINPLTIFEKYLEDLERKYYQKYMDEVDEDDEVIKEAIHEFISLGTQQNYSHFYLGYKEVKKQLKDIHNKVLEFLLSEGVFNKIKYENETKVFFTYQKFENFFIADYLLADFEKNQDIIFNLIKDYSGALSEALFMQLPEKLSKDIFDLNVWLIRDEWICRTYLESLVWRRPDTTNERTFTYINFILNNHDLSDDFLDVTLQLSNIPKHPLNILRLHAWLLKQTMSERDYHWSIYLHDSFIGNGIVERIINWAWDKKEAFAIEDESLYLYGLTLGWFLTSSNRELRDAATKALVNIFTNNANTFLRVLKEFETVNDLYILERLYSIGYGTVLRTNQITDFAELGKYIYDTIFDVDFAIEHILLREYASLTVEYIDSLIDLDIDKEKIHSPYNQKHIWTLPKIEKAEVDKYHDDYLEIYGSALDGDFKIYRVYPAINHFLNLKISDRPHNKLPKERYDDFFNSLTTEQRVEYDKTRIAPNELLTLLNDLTEDEFEEEIKGSDFDLDKIKALRETKLNQSSFKELLSSEQLKEYNECIVGYDRKHEYKHAIDIKSIKRLIFLEAIKLGWNKELFEDFDRRVNSWDRYEHRSERIGKKYQWIAFHSVLAKLADNYEYQDGRSENKISEYKGTYQFYLRDIDPTSIVKNKKKDEKKWWFNINKDFQNLDIADKEWMGSTEKLPSIFQLVQINREGEEYFLQSMNFSIDGTKEDVKYRNLYYHINAFVLNQSDLENFIEWLESVDFYGQDKMPKSDSIQKTFLREYPHSKTFEYFNNYYYGQTDWDDEFDHREGVIPCKVLLTSTSYMNEGRSYDMSVNESIEVALPNKWFVDKMELRQTSKDGEWVNEKNEVVFFDPTVDNCCISEYNENGVLVADKRLLLEFLKKNSFTIVWIMWGEKQVRNTKGKVAGDDDFLGIGEISGYGYIENNEFIEFKKIKYEQ